MTILLPQFNFPEEREKERKKEREKESKERESEREREKSRVRALILVTFLIKIFFLDIYVNIQTSCSKIRMGYFKSTKVHFNRLKIFLLLLFSIVISIFTHIISI